MKVDNVIKKCLGDKWSKNLEAACDFCKQPAVYDGKTTQGPWAYMCEGCFKKHGVGLGLGSGQKLEEVK